jgi:hypothetical protein
MKTQTFSSKVYQNRIWWKTNPSPLQIGITEVVTSLRYNPWSLHQHRLYTNCHRVARWRWKQEPSGIQEHYPGGVSRTLVEMGNGRHWIIIIIVWLIINQRSVIRFLQQLRAQTRNTKYFTKTYREFRSWNTPTEKWELRVNCDVFYGMRAVRYEKQQELENRAINNITLWN